MRPNGSLSLRGRQLSLERQLANSHITKQCTPSCGGAFFSLCKVTRRSRVIAVVMTKHMHTEPFDIPQLLARRHEKHIGARASAELIDLIVFAIAGNLVNAAVGSLSPLFVFAVFIVYFTAFEARSGQTLGKRFLGIRVVNSKGSHPSWGQALVRNLVRPFEAFGLLGLFFVSSTDKGQRIGDLLASTYVVQNGELETLATTDARIAANEAQNSRQVIPLSAAALVLAKSRIADAYKPNKTGLAITADSSAQHGLVVQLDFIDQTDDSWHYTIDGVTISVPRQLADQCAGLQVGASEGKLVVESQS